MRKLIAMVLVLMMIISTVPGMAQAYAAGTYQQTVKGMNGDIVVDVTFGEAALESVVIVSQNETPGLGDVALKTLAEAMSAAKSADVDSVAGATVSSDALKLAVAQAGAAASGLEHAVAQFVPGTYTTTAQGHNGAVTVETTFTADRIEQIKVVNHFESQGVYEKALLTQLPQQIIEHQSLAVDSITGATVASNALISAVKAAAEQAGCDVTALMTAPEKSAPETTAYTADVIIIGAGGAGLSAAVAATQEGASVILIEKEGYVGGNTLVSGGIFNCPDPAMQKEVEMTAGVKLLVETALAETPVSDAHAQLIAKVREQYEAHVAAGNTYLFDSVEWFTLQTWNAGDKVADLELVYTMCENSYDTLTWLNDLGWTFQQGIRQGAGSLYQRTHSSVDHAGVGFINALNAGIKGSNAQIIFDTEATELVMKDGQCVGVLAKDRSGNQLTFNANKNVILATGGFARNTEMLEKYNTSGKWPDLTKITGTNMPGITGDGIRMAEAVGAALRDMDQIQLLQTTQPGTGNCVYAYVAPKEAAGYLFLNAEGKRFIGEDGRRDDISLAALAQTDALFYMLESSDVITDPDNQYDLLGVPMSECINAGAIFKGETLEALCAQVGWDYATVQAEVDAYNANVDANALKDEYGRALFTIKQENGPWYAIPRTPSVHHTMGGVVINAKTEVLDTQGNVIEGLLAAGEVVGGIHGGNRVGGNALVDCITYGRIAGQQAVND